MQIRYTVELDALVLPAVSSLRPPLMRSNVGALNLDAMLCGAV